MKKYRYLFVCLLSSFLFLSPLQSIAQDWLFGIKAGPNFSGVKISPGDDDDGKVGFHAGVFGNVEVGDQLLIQPEVLISFQGDERDGLTYLNIPVVVKYFFTDEFSGHAGVQIGLLLGGEDDIEDFLTTADLGVPFGLEYQINEAFGVGGRYVLGVTNILDSDVSSSVDLFNRVFQLFATYNLN